MLVDLNLPWHERPGADPPAARHQYPSVGVVMLSIYESDEQAFNALQAGAAAYRSKDIHPKDLADILRRVARGEYVINDVVFEEPKVASQLLSQFRSLPQDLSSAPRSRLPAVHPAERPRDRGARAYRGWRQQQGDRRHAQDQYADSQEPYLLDLAQALAQRSHTGGALSLRRIGWIEAPGDIKGRAARGA